MQATRTTTAISLSSISIDSVSTDELFLRLRHKRDARARDELVRRHLPVARKLARRYVGAREPLDDLVQVASVGLVNAVDRFDPDRGLAFSSFAVPTILGALKRYFRDHGWSVHVPRGAQEMALKVENAQQRFEVESGRSPNVDQLAQYLEWSVEDVLDALEAGHAHHSGSLEAPTNDDQDGVGTLADVLGAEDDGFGAVEARMMLAAAARRLNERERRVLTLRAVEDLTQSEIAALIGVSQMQVSRILRRVITQLRDLREDPTPR